MRRLIPVVTVVNQAQAPAAPAPATPVTIPAPAPVYSGYLPADETTITTNGGVQIALKTLGSGGSGGSASSVPAIVYNAYGQITGLTSNTISIDASQVATGTFAAARMPAFTGDVSTAAGSTATTFNAIGIVIALGGAF